MRSASTRARRAISACATATGMLITPTSTPYEAMQPEQIVYMHLDGSHDPAQRPSSEWRFHLDILKARPEVNAIVHAHPPYSTMLAIMGMEIPPVHYMVAVRRRRHHPLRALCDLRHAGAFGTCRARAGRQAGLPAGTSRHDRGRAVAVEGDVACGRGRNAGAAISRLPADRHAAAAVEGGNRERSRPHGRIRPRGASERFSESLALISRRSPLRSSARR